VLGYLIYGIIFASFFAANAGSATGVEREALVFWAIGLGQLGWAGLLTLVLGWTRVTTVGGGLKTGAIVGLLSALGIDLTMYGVTNMSNLTATLVDPVLSMVLFACAGVVIALVVKNPQAQAQ
jgi:hypothetical protein